MSPIKQWFHNWMWERGWAPRREFESLLDNQVEALAELQHIDMVLARRPAIEHIPDRLGKIDHAIKTAATADRGDCDA